MHESLFSVFVLSQLITLPLAWWIGTQMRRG
jgi:hypothetical protein